MKADMLETVYRLLTIHLGTPPEKFEWQVRDRKKKFHRFEGLTPKQFFINHVGLDLSDYVCLIDCPMSDKQYNENYTVEFLGNVVGGEDIRYLNLPSNRLKETSVNSIKDDNPIWFGCDVGKHFHRTLGVMDMDLFDYDSFYNLEFGMDKAARLEYGDSQMTHAMLFTGVDLDLHNKPVKWRVENSWGTKGGEKGYNIMSDKWFDEYNYEVVVHKDCISDKFLELYLNEEAVHLNPWDPMGALAV